MLDKLSRSLDRLDNSMSAVEQQTLTDKLKLIARNSSVNNHMFPGN